MSSNPELYVSIDVETDGPSPGLNNMLSLGSALFTEEEKEIGTFYKKIKPLHSTYQNSDTMKWWETQPEGWQEVNKHQEEPIEAVRAFTSWLEGFEKKYKLVAVGWPIAFDFAFVNYYCWAFAGHNPLGYAGLDIRSYAAGVIGQATYCGLRHGPIIKAVGEIDKNGLRPHVAVDDAIEQGRLFMAIRRSAIKALQLQGEKK